MDEILITTVKKRILDNAEILKEKQVTIYFRLSTIRLEVFILVDQIFTEKENEFWYYFCFMIAEGLDEDIFKIGAGNPKLWEHTSKRCNWEKFDLI